VFRWLAERVRRQPDVGIVDAVLRESLTYLSRGALLDLFNLAHGFEQRRIAGSFIEAGCALGGSAIVIAGAKAPARPFYVYDVFGMIPLPPTRMAVTSTSDTRPSKADSRKGSAPRHITGTKSTSSKR
jgi:asparagine synthase (glutamine-hydrolysing)